MLTNCKHFVNQVLNSPPFPHHFPMCSPLVPRAISKLLCTFAPEIEQVAPSVRGSHPGNGVRPRGRPSPPYLIMLVVMTWKEIVAIILKILIAILSVIGGGGQLAQML